MKIEEAIQQKSFDNPYLKAHINILYTSSWMMLQVNQWLKPIGLTQQQFNVLRILKGSYPQPLTVREITERMIDKMSNASRLVDKLALKKLVEKKEEKDDRRKLNIFMTEKGLGILETASATVMKNLAEVMGTLQEADAVNLNELLDKLRNKEENPRTAG
jgi:DNA-binding MarR family transcriptional regulator